ncbi:glyoxalase [Microbacterium pumilum]|uniref:Glyoxalase/bleomycin resistance/dioxygenase family protein n=1 Tax=Microbacterium pumilum TaxID=344165 RepID=A0ABN2SYA2_9MICO
MDVQFVAGFGPIVRDDAESRRFYQDSLGIVFEEPTPGYLDTHALPGVKVFALWRLAEAAESTFGVSEWPADVPVPQAWLEFELASPIAVAEGEAELRAAGYEILATRHVEPWGQTIARLLSPEGMLVGLSYFDQLHDETIA